MKLVLFDIDGTLLRGGGAGREATRRAIREVFGVDANTDTHDFGGKTDWQNVTELLAVYGYDSVDVGQRMSQYAPALAGHFIDVQRERQPFALPGALDLVTRLRARPDTLLGIITGNVQPVAPIKLRAAGFDPAWFPIGAYGSEAFDREDLPWLALRRAAIHNGFHLTPRAVTVIGDTVRDIDCARALGARVICVLTGFDRAEALAAAAPDALLDDLTQFSDALLG
jgi:phosphoglycolate phosphatase-like HAD superfamily hydrolase